MASWVVKWWNCNLALNGKTFSFKNLTSLFQLPFEANRTPRVLWAFPCRFLLIWYGGSMSPQISAISNQSESHIHLILPFPCLINVMKSTFCMPASLLREKSKDSQSCTTFQPFSSREMPWRATFVPTVVSSTMPSIGWLVQFDPSGAQKTNPTWRFCKAKVSTKLRRS